jgi:hypothetical protein
MRGPATFSFVKMDADVLRRGIFSFTAVAHIFLMRSEAEVCPAIIERVAVFMVDDKAWRRVHNLPV